MCHCNEGNCIPKEFCVISLTPKTEEAKRKEESEKEREKKRKKSKRKKMKRKRKKVIRGFLGKGILYAKH